VGKGEFNIGDRVEMTDATKQSKSRKISQHGQVVGFGRKFSWEIIVHRDGCKNPDRWHKDAWQPEQPST
jgi:hypothetical protein